MKEKKSARRQTSLTRQKEDAIKESERKQLRDLYSKLQKKQRLIEQRIAVESKMEIDNVEVDVDRIVETV